MIKELIDKLVKKYKKDNTICYFIIIIIGLLICAPLFSKGFIVTQDGTAHFSRNYSTIQGIKEGIFLSAIVPNFCGGFGYSWNLFYPPLSTYINTVFYFLVQNYIVAMKLTIILAVIGAGIFMFKFMLNVTKNKNTSLLVSILYITSVYFLADIYIRLAIGEIMTFIFLPILFWGLYNIFYKKGKKNYLLTIGAVGILLSHNISSLIVAILCLILILIHWKKLWKNEDSIQIWKNLFFNGVFIILIVSFFMIPLLEHKLATDYICMVKDGMTSKELVVNSEINLGQLVMILGLIILLSLLLTPICYKKIDKSKRLIYVSLVTLGIATSLMSTAIFPWSIMPDLFLSIQFPWRILLFSTFFLSIIAGTNISLCVVKEKNIRLVLVSLIIILYGIFYVVRLANIDYNFDLSYLYETEKIENIYVFSQQTTNHDYLPAKARTPYIQTRENNVVVLQGNAQIKNESKEGTNLKFDIESNLEDSTLELPYIYYLGYSIKLNEEEIKYKESENGFISIDIPKGQNGIVEVRYSGTKLSKISVILSIVGVICFLIYIKKEKTLYN